ncbi:acyl-CoA synthetase [Burkholderia cenocepacia]|uniref:acyl-CoA synthetase n=1 Tax=Burkholderia cenocepacia TaxID=95486 RepID=UPI001CF1A499|nr:acyl-CoA synthetase [Burkholderia cenocepacia]MCA8010407.1 acyl-CoA synthetase [Burkholderia cenocepacia]
MERVRELAVLEPDKEAIRFPALNLAITYSQLNERANRVAHWLVSVGLQAGDGIALLFENHPVIAEIAIGAERSGLYYTPISTQLKTREIAHVLKDCGARVLIVSAAMRQLAQTLVDAGGTAGVTCFMVGGTAPGFASYEAAIAQTDPSRQLPFRDQGCDFLYSSGTTGLPKGIRTPLIPYGMRGEDLPENKSLRETFGFDADSIYLSTAPLYHAAPLRYLMRMLMFGGRSVVLQKFDPEAALDAIERYRVTHSQWVPTMFVRLLNLSDEARARYDLSSLRVAIHAAAPCPPSVKEQMIDWFGPVIFEYYSGSESVGVTAIDSHEWLTHRGSVGRAICGVLHILDDDDRELPPGEIGRVFFSDGPTFEYHNDPVKTRAVHNDRGWATYGDIGHVDADGYLYLSDRRVDLIISGGVNVYPQEVENVLSEHPAVGDVAVIGVPNVEFGEEVKAIVQTREPTTASPALAADLIAFCRDRLSNIKAPRTVEFVDALPRHDNGKMLRRILKERFR